MIDNDYDNDNEILKFRDFALMLPPVQILFFSKSHSGRSLY